MPFNAFQNQGNEPLSTLLNSTSNSTALNFKLTDIIETGIYDTKEYNPKEALKRVEEISTVHLAQFPGDNQKPKEKGRNLIDDGKIEFPEWSKTETALIDKHFNLNISPKRPSVIEKFGDYTEERRLYVVNEISVQAIGAGDMTVTFFAEDPTVHGFERTTVWEGKFRNYAKVTKSTRA